MSNNKYNTGMILPFSVMLTFVGTILVASYMGLVLNKKINLDNKIAQSKAKYNAESGIALTYTTLGSAAWNMEGLTLIDTITFTGTHQIEGMGSTYNIRMEASLNPINKKPQRESFAYGSSTVNNIWGKSATLVDSVSMKFELETLAEYMYLTNHENAGGAPGIFGTQGSENNLSRGKPCFGGDDVLGNNQELAGHIQTLDPMLICAGWPTPTFNNLVYITRADEDFVNSEFNTTGVNIGDPILPDFGLCGCDEDDIFLNQTGPEEHPGYEVREKVCFPLSGYHSTISGASLETTHDATEMLRFSNQGNLNAPLKDTLIMTDIEFINSGGYRIKRWWYLLPPYLKADILKCSAGDCNTCDGTPDVTTDCNGDGLWDYQYSMPQHLEGMPTDPADIATICDDYQEIGVGSGNYRGDITQCKIYTESLNDFHSLLLTSDATPQLLGPWYINYNDQNDQEEFNHNYGNYTYSQHPGGGSTRLSHFDVENIPKYFGDKDWDEASWLFQETVNYADGGNLIQNEIISVPGNEAVIHVKGGPVRVHGVYNGRYTVVTSGYDATNADLNSLQITDNATYGGWMTYRRHAWYNSSVMGSGIPIDTIRTNIWITGDLVNVDAGSYGGPPQPVVMNVNNEGICNYDAPGDCGGSDNVLGLVSSSNVIIANSLENRAGGIDIHAHVVGLNESFVMHYYQNSFRAGTGLCNGNGPYNYNIADMDCQQTPPHADNRGAALYNDNTENRGDIRLWGGVIQDYRGYMMRNAAGPYNSGDIGMDKDYNYDNNLYFPPPYFPYLDDCPVDGYHTVRMKISDYGQIESTN